jgi:IMP dehydrogenase
METALSFDDVLLLPQHSDIAHRGDIDISVDLKRFGKIRSPIISSPMDTVTGGRLAKMMWHLGGLGIIHRYNSVTSQCDEVDTACTTSGVSNPTHHCGAAVGVTGDYLERAVRLVEKGACLICVDVAHGDHSQVVYAVERIRKEVGSRVHIMAGNVATREGFDLLVRSGADSVRVGIGGGSICSTRTQTGHGAPTLWSIIECAKSENSGEAAIIADGGIKTSGDAVKALAAGADAVMLGSMLSGTDETPGDPVWMNLRSYKKYRGMASVEAQVSWRGHAASEEGVTAWVPCKGPLHEVLGSIERGIRSGLSYSGAVSIANLQAKAKFMRITPAGILESTTHINNI